MLGAALIVGDLLHHKKIRWIGEAGMALVLGLILGGLIAAGGAGHKFTSWLQFKVRLQLYAAM